MKVLILIDEDGNQVKGAVPHILKDNEELEKTIFDFNDNIARITTENPSEGCWMTYEVNEKEKNIYQVSMLRMVNIFQTIE